MRPTSAFAMTWLLFATTLVQADGCKFTATGRKVPEREQRAMIAWADGVETLHVATLADATSEGTVWIVPVRAAATAVRAEPVEEFPTVVYYETLRRKAEERLRFRTQVTATLNSGGLCCMLAMGGCDDRKSASEVSRVERLGMVVTVVSADTRAGLTSYLARQGVNHRAADLSSLDPYFDRPGHAFVCGWVARRDEPIKATGLQVEFPTPTLWFPLRPTRAYTEPVQTVVYTRGFVKPADGCDLPDLRCEYVYGIVENRGLGRVFEHRLDDHPDSWKQEELTRVTLTTDPQKWDRDLELVPGTTTSGSVARFVIGSTGDRLLVCGSIVLGGLLGLVLPLLTVPRGQRQAADYLGGGLTGAALILTLWASVATFWLWRHMRFGSGPNQPHKYVVVPPLLAAAHFGAVAGVCWLLKVWIASGQ